MSQTKPENEGLVFNQSTVSKGILGALVILAAANHDFAALFFLTTGGALVHYMDGCNSVTQDSETLKENFAKLRAILVGQFGHVDFAKLQQDLRGLVGQANTASTTDVAQAVTDSDLEVSSAATTDVLQSNPILVKKPSRPEVPTDAVA
jgi:hypothetical protein